MSRRAAPSLNGRIVRPLGLRRRASHRHRWPFSGRASAVEHLAVVPALRRELRGAGRGVIPQGSRRPHRGRGRGRAWDLRSHVGRVCSWPLIWRAGAVHVGRRMDRPQPAWALRLARIDDAAALQALEDSCFVADRISRRSYQRLLRRDSAQIVIATSGENDGQSALCGSLVLLFRRGTGVARVYSIAVAPQARGQGLASQLLAHAKRLARQRGCGRITAEIRDDNVASIATFRRAGFEIFGRYEGYYDDGRAAVRVRQAL